MGPKLVGPACGSKTCVCMRPVLSISFSVFLLRGYQNVAKYTSLYRYIERVGLVLRWPRPWRGKNVQSSLALGRDGGKPRLFPNVTPHRMTSHRPSFYRYGKSILFSKEFTYSKSPIASILHTYTGKIMLSFCPDIASRTDPSPIIIPYRTTSSKISNRD